MSDNDDSNNYQPGDVANGHMLGTDGQWHLMSAAGSESAPPAGSVVVSKRALTIAAVATGGAFLLALLLVAGLVGSSSSPTAADSSSSSAQPTKSPSPEASTSPTPSRSATAPPSPTPTREPVAPAPPAPPRQYTALDDRTWALIAKDPDAHIGESYLVFGEVTQFDSATGTSAFRANVAAANVCEYGFFDGDNTLLQAATGVDLANVVTDDVFAAQVTVMGSFSYDTSIGGSATVPRLQVDSIEVQGTCEY